MFLITWKDMGEASTLTQRELDTYEYWKADGFTRVVNSVWLVPGTHPEDIPGYRHYSHFNFNPLHKDEEDLFDDEAYPDYEDDYSEDDSYGDDYYDNGEDDDLDCDVCQNCGGYFAWTKHHAEVARRTGFKGQRCIRCMNNETWCEEQEGC